MPSGLSRDVLQYIDDAALDEDGQWSEFINDDTDLSVHSDEPFVVWVGSYYARIRIMDDESELSALSHEENDVVKGDMSDSDVVVVPTPTRRVKKSKRTRTAAPNVNTDDEDAAITPGDSMFARKNGVKASTLPPAMPTRSTTRSAGKSVSVSSDDVFGSKPVSRLLLLLLLSVDPVVNFCGFIYHSVEGRQSTRSQNSRADEQAASTEGGGSVRSKIFMRRIPVAQTPGTPPETLDTRMERIMARFMENQMPFIAAAVINKVLPAINGAVTAGNAAAPLNVLRGATPLTSPRPMPQSSASNGQEIVSLVDTHNGDQGATNSSGSSIPVKDRAGDSVGRGIAKPAASSQSVLRGSGASARASISVPSASVSSDGVAGTVSRRPSEALSNMEKVFATKRKQMGANGVQSAVSVGAPRLMNLCLILSRPEDGGRKTGGDGSPASSKKQRVMEDDLTIRVS
ncbi:hypothetical protein R3P38DRAFT_2801370 [Favolaschia claudopus]|uniref:Uncharacterized protein n=1 Tax=Favolaschia claudopus TaxID=2862362 RepID=A0AAV9ZW18_9AGAR